MLYRFYDTMVNDEKFAKIHELYTNAVGPGIHKYNYQDLYYTLIFTNNETEERIYVDASETTFAKTLTEDEVIDCSLNEKYQKIKNPDDFKNTTAKYFICQICNRIHKIEEGHIVEDLGDDNLSMICDRCYDKEAYNNCEHCGRYRVLSHDKNRSFNYEFDFRRSTLTSKSYCKKCFHELFSICSGCGKHFLKDDPKLELVDGANYSCGCDYDSTIHSYHGSSIKPAFYHLDGETRENNLHMGFELEVDMPSNDDDDDDDYYDYNDEKEECIGYFTKYFPKFFFKYEEDGSLNHGWENISQPATLAYHMSLKDKYGKMFKEIRTSGYRSHDGGSCGLHIHLDKAYFGENEEEAEAKLITLFELHKENLAKFSRRRGEGQRHWCNNYSDHMDTSDTTEIVKKKKTLGRYYAVNLTNNNTIEIRLWRGTLRLETFIATLKLTARIAELCKTKSNAEISTLTWEEILGNDEDILAYWETVKERSI